MGGTKHAPVGERGRQSLDVRGIPVDMDKSMQRLREYLGFPVGLELVLEEEEEEEKKPASTC